MAHPYLIDLYLAMSPTATPVLRSNLSVPFQNCYRATQIVILRLMHVREWFI